MTPNDPSGFNTRGGRLYAENVALADIAAAHGTPCFVYSKAALIAAYTGFDTAFAAHPHLVCYAVKANSSLAILNDLTAMGVHIAIDDFGTGYSSLLYLKRMPATELKIDRAFVHDLECNDEDAAIVSSIIALGRTLQLQVVAEGVETQAQREYLSELGCDQLQGYHLGRPMEAEEFLRKVAG